MLLEHGADPSIANQCGEFPLDTLLAPWETTKCVANLLQVEVDRQELVAGRRRVAAMLPQVQRDPGLVRNSSKLEPYLAAITAVLFYAPLFGHLWFLWFLCWLVAGFAICAAVGRTLQWEPLPAIPRRQRQVN